MCTLIIARQAVPGLPLLVAANRDERLDRPARPPAWRDAGSDRVLAPLDLAGGGTWLGASARGLLVAVTNRFGHRPDPQRRSRGLLVHDLLARPDVESAADQAAAVVAEHYNPFHLVVADAHAAYLIWHDGSSVRKQALDPGVHVVIERSLGAAPSEREGYVRAQASALAQRPFDRERWQALLAHHTEPAFESVCVHVDEHGYGTRSAALIRIDGRGLRSFLFADGPPCRSGFVEYATAADAAGEAVAGRDEH